MAEFKLGRIRFIWKDSWTSGTVYYKDDIVRHGGNSYICLTGHTSSDSFATDLTAYWNTITEGQEWKGNWASSTQYKVNDVVKYGGYLYIANTEHTSADASVDLGLEQDQDIDEVTGLPGPESKWDLYAEGFDYKGDWSAGEAYKVNDLVLYGATVYLCTVSHISATFEEPDFLGLEEDIEKWDIFSKGFDWKQEWQPQVRYKLNDIVRYGGQIYVANEGHKSASTVALGLEADQTKWDYFHKGIEFKQSWTPGVRYKVNDIVKYGSGLWICVAHHTSQTNFVQDESNWSQFVEGLEFEDSWSPTRKYQPGDLASYGGFVYVSLTNNIDSKPTENETDWSVFITGFRFKGVYGEDSSGQDYQVGDVVRLGGYTYLCIQDHEDIQRPPNTEYWEQLNPGIEWKSDWIDGEFFDLGDAVRFGVNSYICVQSHTSDEVTDQNRPDQDSEGVFWNLLAGGAETAVLNTAGDLVYYGGAGPVRLPIGDSGQVLRVNANSSAPQWAFLGAIENIFYVEKVTGKDQAAPTYGATIDQPWNSIRYAAEQIDKGALKPNATRLLKINKAWMQEELVDYVADKIANAGAGSIWDGFSNDNETLSRENLGSVIESLIHDLSHGGNVETRLNALSYFDSSGDLSTAAADEYEQLIDVLNYLDTLIDSVMSNKVPNVVYNDDINTFKQTIDNDLQEEDQAQAVVSSLINLITSALAAQNSSGIPSRFVPNTTISVKTGKFQEVLPINIPESCAVVGDELRSSRIEASPSIFDISDVDQTLAAIERLQVGIVNIITGSSEINSSPGNSLSYVPTGNVVGDSSTASIAADLVQQIYDYIDWGVNGATGDSTRPLMTGTNTPRTDTAFTYSVEAIEKNRQFLISEVVAFVENTYPNYSFDEDLFRRDIDRYIDAIQYDLIYEGNYKSLMSARYYVNATNGSRLEDMFYVRNATGLRNCTVAGLEGELGPENEFGTRRPSAGAYVSLDPGWGPDDERVWITTRSPYVQNVTTFGTCCIGAKIDGDLHNGGNDSIVANDFTQVLSDGIGVWCTNLGRTELVSVFSYYGYIGYLAEAGGKIRATNGNSSYGTFGTVAEGIDITEIPVTGTVDNRSFEAIIDRVITDGNSILSIEYLNAGNNYSDTLTAIQSVSIASGAIDSNRTGGFYSGVTGTSITGSGQEFTINVTSDTGIITVESIDSGGTGFTAGDTITVDSSEIGGTGSGFTLEVDTVGAATEFVVAGDGFGAEIDSVQVNDNAVFEVRMLDTDVTGNSEGDFGGDGYFTSVNIAQGGDETSITLSNTETALSSQLPGMAVFLSAGRGSGQYGVVAEYNSGTKIAQIGDSAVGLVETTEVDGSNNITVTDTSELAAGVEIKFTGSEFGGLEAGVTYLVDTVVDSTTITITDQVGDPVSLSAETGSMFLYSPGWNLLPGLTAAETVLDGTTEYTIEPRVVIDSPTGGGYAEGAKGRALVDDEKIVQINIWDPGSGYTAVPTVTIVDPNNTVDVPVQARIGNGVLAQPTWVDRGQAFQSVQIEVTGEGFADRFQPGQFLRVKNLTDVPLPGSNLELSSLPGQIFKLVVVRQLTGTGPSGEQPPFSAQLQVSPDITISEAPAHNETFELRIRYSQVRLTGHDFLDIGTGNKEETNYPNEPENEPNPEAETIENNGGRVFYTSTDQDGNFRVGDLFSVEQSTGVATLNADAFNLSGLQELSLGELGLGDTGVSITEFSTDGTFSADSDNIVPTQKAIRTFITSQIGGGAATLNVNSITAGEVQILANQIDNTAGNEIRILTKMDFEEGIDGVPVALNYFLSQ